MDTTPTETVDPAAAGLRMPAEWTAHARCWMGWPPSCADYYPDLDAARTQHAAVARAIAAFEPVTLLARPAEHAEAAARCGPTVEVLQWPLGEAWTRDTGPTYVIDRAGRALGVDWRFNNYGDKWPDYADDAALAGRILAHGGVPRIEAPLVLEGGAVHSDGAGTVLTTVEVVLDPARNPGLTRAGAEDLLRLYIGAERVIWLHAALEYDDTDGHVDNLACFAAPGRVLALGCPDTGDTQYAAVQDNLARLRAATDARGRPLEVIEVPHPPREDCAGHRVPYSYINFYPANGGVVVPAFGAATDAEAAAIIGAAFSDRRLTTVRADAIARGGGCIHCITQPEPRV